MTRKEKKLGSRKVKIYSQHDPHLNVVDPVSWILILALQFGVTESATIDDVHLKAQARRDKTVT
jgi:hypothetical protein